MPDGIGGLGGEAAAGEGQQISGGQVDSGQQQQGGDSGGGNDNPAWAEILQVLPTSLHSQVRPALEKWDRGVQQRFEQVQQQYSPYKSFAEQKVSPEDIEVALGIAQRINTDPTGFFQTFQEMFKDQLGNAQGQGQSAEGNDPEFDLDDYTQQQQQDDPRLLQIQQQQEMLNQWFMEQQNQKMQEEADAALENDLKNLHDQYGDFNERYVLGLAMAGVPLEDAVKEYQGIVGGAGRQPDPNVPNVLTPGGGLPAEQVDPRKLDGPGTRSVVEQMLRAAAQKDT